MPTVQEAKNAKRTTFSIEDKESLIEYAKEVSYERTRVEAQLLDEHITARQALVESMKPEQQARFAEHLKTLPRTTPAEVAAPAAREIGFPTTCISYQVMRPPFTTNWWAQPSRAGAPVRISTSCVSILTHQSLGLTAMSAEAIPSEGALSVQAAIGDFFNARCQNIGTWFIGEGNRAFAVFGQIADTGITLPSNGFMSVEVDLAMEGQVGWSNFMFPGEPGSGLGLVGFIGIGGLTFQTFDGTQQTLNQTSERFLLGSASAHFPGVVDRRPTFTLRQITFLPPSSGTLKYAIAISADLTAFRSTPIEHGGFPGFAHANLTVPGTPGPLQPGTPLKVKEIRTAICLWP
jgi:hypothetical protein